MHSTSQQSVIYKNRILQAMGYAFVLIVYLIPSPLLAAQIFSTETGKIKVETIAQSLDSPWALVFLPDKRILVTERPGRIRLITLEGKISDPLKGVPKVFARGQGGLLDLTLAPDFTQSQMIYFTFAELGADNMAGTAIAKARLTDTALEDVQVIFRQSPKTPGGNHFGSRLRFARDGTLFAGLGERFNFSKEAQKLDNHLGKVIRINPDGSVPKDNPFVNVKGALPEIWSYGHRNIQGAAIHPETGQFWIHEHGPRGGDEINVPQAGKNYGWPEASYGTHYSLAPIEHDHKGRGYIEPLYHWTPSIAPSGMMFYTGDLFPQ